jgi:protein-L-isoaspartate O-methyltransferase
MPRLDEEGDAPFGREVAQEVGFLIDLMDLKPTEAILDVAAGAGRHALELARRGFKKVTALDLSDQLIEIGKRCAAEAGVSVTFVKGDARQPVGKGTFDAALVLGGGAFGLMDTDAENHAILEATFEALRPGGRVAVSAMNLLWIVRNLEDLSGFDPQTHYLATKERVMVEGGAEEELPLRERYYGFPGLRRDLERAGFRNVIGFGADTGRLSSRAINTESPQILLYALKPKS